MPNKKLSEQEDSSIFDLQELKKSLPKVDDESKVSDDPNLLDNQGEASDDQT